MPSNIELTSDGVSNPVIGGVCRENAVRIVAFSWGLCAYIPLGVLYLNLLLMLLAIAFSTNLRQRLRALSGGALFVPALAMLAWSVLVVALGDWYPDSASRLFHVCRVALLLCLGMMLTYEEVLVAFAGFLSASVIAALVVAVHHAWGLPDWTVWSSLLASRNNFSSGNMISMAAASGIFLCLALHPAGARDLRRIALALAMILGATVSLHALSRNSQLLLGVLLGVCLMHRLRTSRERLAGIAAMLLLMAAVWHLSPMTHDRLAEMAVDLQAANEHADYSTSVGVRWRMYQEAAQGIADHPLLGAGLGSWLPHWRSVWSQISQNLPPHSQLEFASINNPHNDFLLAGMETGIPGMLILFWLLGRAIQKAWRQRSAMGGVSTIMGATVFTTAMVNAPFRDAALGMTMLWLLGASLAEQRTAQ